MAYPPSLAPSSTPSAAPSRAPTRHPSHAPRPRLSRSLPGSCSSSDARTITRTMTSTLTVVCTDSGPVGGTDLISFPDTLQSSDIPWPLRLLRYWRHLESHHLLQLWLNHWRPRWLRLSHLGTDCARSLLVFQRLLSLGVPQPSELESPLCHMLLCSFW